MSSANEELRERLGELDDLGQAGSLLSWDQQTQMPPGGGAQRAQQLATLRRLVHGRFTAPETGALLAEAEAAAVGLPADHDDRCLARVVRRDFERARKLPTDFVANWARDRILSNEVWRDARQANDFAAFRPHLEKMVDYARRAADYYGYQEHPYDALLEGYEPGLTTAAVRRVFDRLRPAQVALARAIAACEPPRADFLTGDYPEAGQREFGMAVAADFGYDLRRGRLDIAPHPFATSFGRDDVRITTRYDPHFLPQAIFAIFHEAGHALYEQNLSPALARTPLARGCSNIFHESQSRLWENIVGRSRPFWAHYYPRLQALFPQPLAAVSADEFYRAVNRVQPSLIRVEADEVTYNLHIILRFDLELALVEGSLPVADLPAAWTARMQEYLGITPPDDRDGVMQDTHWSTGSLGYFPTYALGNVMAAQIFTTARRAHPGIETEIGAGRFAAILGWLTEHVYQHGRRFFPEELAVRVNGGPLDPAPYLRYLQEKFRSLYGLGDPAAAAS